jgi:hypothetical protein
MGEPCGIPSKLKTFLDENKDVLKKLHSEWSLYSNTNVGGKTILLKSNPMCYVEFGVHRYHNAMRLKKVIEKYKLDLLNIPNKYIYSLIDEKDKKDKKDKKEGEHIYSDENSLVVSDRPKGVFGLDIMVTIAQIRQLYTFVTKGQYYGLHRSNYIVGDNGVINIIDTGYPEVLQKDDAIKNRIDYIKNGNGIHSKSKTFMNPPLNDPLIQIELCTYGPKVFLTDEAQEWFDSELKKREKLRLKYKKKLEKGQKMDGYFENISSYLEFDEDLYD